MFKQSYFNFTASFGELNPYELDHVCEVMYKKFQQLAGEMKTNGDDDLSFSEQDVKHVLVKTMIEVRVFLAEHRKEEAERLLEATRKTTYAADMQAIERGIDEQ